MTLKVLIAVTHLLGAGHLTRAAAIGRALAADGHRVTLVSGGRPAPLIGVGGLDLVQLPPVRATEDDLATLRDQDGREAGPALMQARRDLLLATLRSTGPDIVVTELFPFGRRSLSDEFTALVEAARAMRPLVVSSVRDILVAPTKRAKIDRAHATVQEHYDAVLVHSDPSLIPLETSWPVDDALAARLVYTGFVDGPEAPSPLMEETRGFPSPLWGGPSRAAGASRGGGGAEGTAIALSCTTSTPGGAPKSGLPDLGLKMRNSATAEFRCLLGPPHKGEGNEPCRDILVSGGSSAAGLLLYRAAIAAARLLPDRRWRLLVGAGIDAADMAALRRAAGPNVAVEPATPNFRRDLSAAAVFVGQAGYNTVMDCLATGTRTVFVPFERGGETEQRLRAERLRAAGIAAVLPEAELDGTRLAAEVARSLAGARPAALTVARDGAARTAALLARMAAEARR